MWSKDWWVERTFTQDTPQKTRVQHSDNDADRKTYQTGPSSERF